MPKVEELRTVTLFERHWRVIRSLAELGLSQVEIDMKVGLRTQEEMVQSIAAMGLFRVYLADMTQFQQQTTIERSHLGAGVSVTEWGDGIKLYSSTGEITLTGQMLYQLTLFISQLSNQRLAEVQSQDKPGD